MKNKIGIVIDFSLRLPEFEQTYTLFKQSIFEKKEYAHLDQEEGFTKKALKAKKEVNYFENLEENNKKAFEFYMKTVTPSVFDEDFDITLDKYFYSSEDKKKFLDLYSFNLYATGGLLNKQDAYLINTCQSKLTDVVLIDYVQSSKKIPNTFAFLGKSGLIVKEVKFVFSQEELNEVKKDLIDCWDPYSNKDQITKTDNGGKPTQALYDWFLNLEKKINNKENE